MTTLPSVKTKASTFTKGVIAIDNGGKYTKVMSNKNQDVFLSVKGEGFLRKIGNDSSMKHDFDIYWEGNHYFAGTLAARESRKKWIGYTDSKNTAYFILSILIACHQYGYDDNYVVTCVPIEYHIESEKLAIKEALQKEHTITINGVEKKFRISEVAVTAEGVNAFWVLEPYDKVRWLDLGSRTVNFATTEVIEDEVFPIDKESGTFPELGLDKAKVNDYAQYAESIRGQLGEYEWKETDTVYIIGGGGEIPELVAAIKKFYINSIVPETPQMIQAKGMLELGKAVFNID